MFGFLISFGIRCNVGVAVSPEIQWSPENIEHVDASFLWGFIATQILGGFLAAKVPANLCFGIAIFISSCLNLLLPLAIKLSPLAVIGVRVLQGLAEGVTFPACHGILRWWASSPDRSILTSIAYCGTFIGHAIGMSLSSILVEKIGWRSPFYIYGFAGLLWYFLWLWLAFEKPSTHPAIPEEELLYIEQSLAKTSSNSSSTIFSKDLLKIFIRLPVWANLILTFTWSMVFFFLQQSIIKFLIDVQGEYPRWPGLRYLILAITLILGAFISDLLRKKSSFSTTTVRKIFTSGGFAIQLVFILGIIFNNLPQLCLFGAFITSGLALSGLKANLLDIAPRYASILMGITTCAGVSGYMQCYAIIEYFINKTHNIDYNFDTVVTNWRNAILTIAGIHLLGTVFFAIFASGELQSWAMVKDIEEKIEINLDENKTKEEVQADPEK